MLVIFGNGYVAKAFVKQNPTKNIKVVTRHPTHSIHINACDYKSIHSVLSEADWVLHTIPPVKNKAADDQDIVLDSFQQHLQNKPICYLSATSVYGDHQGNWVTETSETNPTSNAGKTRLVIEKKLQQITDKFWIFRLSGIYGPGRSVFDRPDSLNACVIKNTHVFSRIHIDDIVAFLSTLPHPPYGIYNLADDLPANTYDLANEACTLLEKPAPKIIDFDTHQQNLSPRMRDFYRDHKKVSNEKLKQYHQLIHPNYQSGLRAIYQKQDNKHSIL